MSTRVVEPPRTLGGRSNEEGKLYDRCSPKHHFGKGMTILELMAEDATSDPDFRALSADSKASALLLRLDRNNEHMDMTVLRYPMLVHRPILQFDEFKVCSDVSVGFGGLSPAAWALSNDNHSIHMLRIEKTRVNGMDIDHMPMKCDLLERIFKEFWYQTYET